MFEFQMEIKEAGSVNGEAFAKCKMYEVQDARLRNPKFRVDDFSPKDMNETLEYVNRAFYFAPLYVWIDGE